MAFGANTIWEVRTGGNDGNGGGFDPGATLSITNLTTDTNTGNTASPVVSSASYSFVAGDVGAWVFIKSGTNWIPGWYQIASVSGGKATLTAAAGSAYKYAAIGPYTVTTGDGVATVGTPTNGTATIDYSQQNAATVTGTASSSTTTVTATTAIFHPGMVGNYITDGTTWKEITGYTSTTVVTVDAAPSWTSASVTVGGALATPGKAGGLKVAGNDIFIASGTYTIASTTANVATGRVSDTTGGVDASNCSHWVGYNSTRTISSTDSTRPLLQVASSGFTSSTVVTTSGNYMRWANFEIDGASKTSITGFSISGGFGVPVVRIKVSNCTTKGLVAPSGTLYTHIVQCEVTGCSGTSALEAGCPVTSCYIHDNTVVGVKDAGGATFTYVISESNSGASSDGFSAATFVGTTFFGCVAYNNGRHGFYFSGSNFATYLINCISYGHSAGYGFAATSVRDQLFAYSCAAGNNSSGNYDTTSLIHFVSGVANLSADPFTNAAAGDFSLNNTAGGGAVCRAAGIPGVFPGGLTTGYLDIGAAPHQDSGGGGGMGVLIGSGGGLIR